MSTDAAAALVWEEPPPRRGGRSTPDPVEREVADALRERAGHSAIVASYTSHHEAILLQRRIRRGAPGSAWAPDDNGLGFEAVVRKAADRDWRVYARARHPDERLGNAP